MRVATAYPGLVDAYLDEQGVAVDLVPLDGAVESAVELGVADAVADVVSTGTTLRQAGLELFGDPILLSEGILVRREDDGVRARLDAWTADTVVGLVERYGPELTSVISSTIQRWDAREASEKIELHVGRDLQFIRLNGTIVGALVGLVIHAVSQLLL